MTRRLALALQARKKLLRMLEKGEITVKQAADYAMVSKECVRGWIGGRFDPQTRHEAHARRLIERTISPDRKPAAAERRAEAERAKETWDWKNDADQLDESAAAQKD
jgi:DNA transposition AAA+ family ATPase